MSANVIQPGSRRVFPSGREIEVTGLVGSGPFAGEWEYRYVESGVTGINSALDLFNTTAPAPTNPSGGAVTSTPAPSDDTTPEPFSVEGMRIVSGWLVEPVDGCTRGGEDQFGHEAHERGCGLEPVAQLDDLPGWPGERGSRPTTAEAVAAIKKRLSWASMHWGTESVHEDAWAHIADAVLNLWDGEVTQ